MKREGQLVECGIDGCIAREEIPKGKLILVEYPVFRVFTDSKPNKILEKMRGLETESVSDLGNLRINGQSVLVQYHHPNGAPIPPNVLTAIYRRYQLRCGTDLRGGVDAMASGLFYKACYFVPV